MNEIVGTFVLVFTILYFTNATIEDVQGLSTYAEVKVLTKGHYNSKIVIQLRSKVKEQTVLESDGPLLITHWGLSGPAILKLSAWGATILNEYKYNFRITVNWVPEYTTEMLETVFFEIKNVEAKKTIVRTNAVDIPRRLWINLTKASGIDKTCLLYTSPSPRDRQKSRMPSSA